jgi:hypothetical protein
VPAGLHVTRRRRFPPWGSGCRFRVLAGVSRDARETLGMDEPQSSRRALTSRLLRPADASVRPASDSTLAARPRQVCRFDHRRIRIHLEAIAMRVPGSELAIARAHPVRDAMSFTMCAASLPTPGRNPDDIA